MSGFATMVLTEIQIQLASPFWLADQPGAPDPASGKGPEWGKASPVGLLLLVLCLIAVFFLGRSMTRHMKKVPKSFDPPADSTQDSVKQPS